MDVPLKAAKPDQGLVASRSPDDLNAFSAKTIEDTAEGVHQRAPARMAAGKESPRAENFMNIAIEDTVEHARIPELSGGPNHQTAGDLTTRLETLCYELSDRLDALARYDRRMAGATTDVELRFWEKLKELEIGNVERLKQFVHGHLDKIDHYESLMCAPSGEAHAAN